MSFVSVTRLRLRSLRFLPSFCLLTSRALGQVERAQGFDAGMLLADRRFAFWTLTSWRDEAAMRAYMGAGAHQRAMPRLAGICDEASVVHWTQAVDTALSWPEAVIRMRRDGRPSRLRHPSSDHAAMTFAEPKGRLPMHIKQKPRPSA